MDRLVGQAVPDRSENKFRVACLQGIVRHSLTYGDELLSVPIGVIRGSFLVPS